MVKDVGSEVRRMLMGMLREEVERRRGGSGVDLDELRMLVGMWKQLGVGGVSGLDFSDEEEKEGHVGGNEEVVGKLVERMMGMLGVGGEEG